MKYRELQSILKDMRARGYDVRVKLSAKLAELNDEYNRLMTIERNHTSLESLPIVEETTDLDSPESQELEYQLSHEEPVVKSFEDVIAQGEPLVSEEVAKYSELWGRSQSITVNPDIELINQACAHDDSQSPYENWRREWDRQRDTERIEQIDEEIQSIGEAVQAITKRKEHIVKEREEILNKYRRVPTKPSGLRDMIVNEVTNFVPQREASVFIPKRTESEDNESIPMYELTRRNSMRGQQIHHEGHNTSIVSESPIQGQT